METLGLIGGMSWHSTATYYRIINEVVSAARGGHASARISLQSLDFSEIRECQVAGDWDRAAALLTEAAQRCVQGGATTVAICTNLMHKVAPQVEAAIDVPLAHIGDAIGAEAGRHGWSTLGILGTRWVMEEDFYAGRLARHGIGVVVPDAPTRDQVDTIVFDELTQGIIRDTSRATYVDTIRRLADQGAEAVVLACTEVGLLISPEDSPLPLIDSAEVHARHLAGIALGAGLPTA
ncbi:aspartate/glutamate racemase family protein [Nocardioides sp. cx-173]|uniref:aspartate/glutamate racemase family protein n=1 Tax=Nocardioides sp. cx-173 TaxID=2898796 RepID=UPI001E3D45F9|nr:aspartate/glutamate racemase family protein [Nocardioides sp. cx-173]MCD4525316.1 aspartate/glutamate racemase family protein [Nocardioides sp. cx-173]UGB40886.1 aspartate/glutamate racemase family protein [Nocardioides sp. cx-173]